MAEQLRKMGVTTAAFDWRGHGDHFCENEQDLSEQTLINDTIDVLVHLNKIFP